MSLVAPLLRLVSAAVSLFAFIRVMRGKMDGIGILQELAENAEVDSRKDSRSPVSELVERLDLKTLSALRTTRSNSVIDRRHDMRSHRDSFGSVFHPAAYHAAVMA